MTYRQRSRFHSHFESEIAGHLEEIGFLVAPGGYHDILPRSMCDVLKRRDTPTGEHLRMGADIVAVHPDARLELLVDAKTNPDGRHKNQSVELRQLIGHLRTEEVRCLYAYRDDFAEPGLDVGWWVHDMPPVSVVLIPDRWSGEREQRYRDLCYDWLPGVRIVGTGSLNGSNTPLAIIDEHELRGLQPWQTLLEDALAEAAQAVPA